MTRLVRSAIGRWPGARLRRAWLGSLATAMNTHGKGLSVLIAAADDPSRPPQADPGQRFATVSAISAISA